MFSNYLKPTLYDYCDCTDYVFMKGHTTNECNVCESICKINYNTYIHDKKIYIKTCYLCHIVMNFKKYHSNKIFLISSTKSQLEIINKINDHYLNTEEIPNPLDIDKSCKIVSNLNVAEFMRNPNNNIKLYFNPNVLSYFTDTTCNMFQKKKNPNVEYNSMKSEYLTLIDFYDQLKSIKHIKLKLQQKNKDEDLIECEKSFEQKNNHKKIISTIKQRLIECK